MLQLIKRLFIMIIQLQNRQSRCQRERSSAAPLARIDMSVAHFRRQISHKKISRQSKCRRNTAVSRFTMAAISNTFMDR